MSNPAPRPDDYAPPTPEQLAEYLDAHPFAPPSPWAARVPLIVLVAVMVPVLLLDSLLAAVLPWFALAGVYVWMVARVRRAQALEGEVNRLGEFAMLRRYREALKRAWGIVPRVNHHPALLTRTLAVIGHCCDDQRAHETAMVAYDRVLELVPPQHPGAVHLRLQRAIAAFRCDRLADGDNELRKLRGTMDQVEADPAQGAYRLARLVQDVRTHHYADAAAQDRGLVEALRPLGVEAAYGYGLMAWCHHAMASGDPAERWRAASLWWGRATLLLPPEALIWQFPELAPMADLPAEPPAVPVDRGPVDDTSTGPAPDVPSAGEDCDEGDEP